MFVIHSNDLCVTEKSVVKSPAKVQELLSQADESFMIVGSESLTQSIEV
jgi:hypothetical protein